jgi:hypothetical protein
MTQLALVSFASFSPRCAGPEGPARRATAAPFRKGRARPRRVTRSFFQTIHQRQIARQQPPARASSDHLSPQSRNPRHGHTLAEANRASRRTGPRIPKDTRSATRPRWPEPERATPTTRNLTASSAASRNQSRRGLPSSPHAMSARPKRLTATMHPACRTKNDQPAISSHPG